jgi:predicted phosphodiesterase
MGATKKTLIISDCHFPYENKEAIKTALEAGKENNVNRIILNGDIIDFHAISRFQKDPKERDLRNEIERTREFIYSLRKKFPRAEIIYKDGNHEARLTAYLWSKAEEFSDLPELSLQSLLHFKQNKIVFSAKDEVIKNGKLSVIHGHEAGSICTVYPARALFLTSLTNTIAGHCHRQSSFVKRTLTGEIYKTFTTGCMCSLKSDYATHNDWVNSFALVETEKNGDFEVRLVGI